MKKYMISYQLHGGTCGNRVFDSLPEAKKWGNGLALAIKSCSYFWYMESDKLTKEIMEVSDEEFASC